MHKIFFGINGCSSTRNGLRGFASDDTVIFLRANSVNEENREKYEPKD